MTGQVATKPRKKPQQERAQKRVQLLLDATAEVLREHGYDRASTNKIATVAGVSIGSLYQYFPGKEALVAALIERQGQRELDLFKSKLGEVQQRPLAEVVQVIVDAFIELHRMDSRLHSVLVEQIPRVGDLQKVEQSDGEATRLIREFIGNRQAELDVSDVDLAAFIVMHSVEAVVHQAILQNPDLLEQQAFADELCALVTSYLGIR